MKFFGVPETEASESEDGKAITTRDVLNELMEDVLGVGDPH